MGNKIRENRHLEFNSRSFQITNTVKILLKTRLLIFTLIFCLLFFIGIKTNAQEEISCACANLADNMKLVRVGISNNNFKSLIYDDLSIVATSDYTAYEKKSKKQIIKLFANDVVRIKSNKYGFYLTINNNIVAKNIQDSIVFDCPNGLLGVQGLRRKGEPAMYHGVFEITPKNDSSFYLVNVLSLNAYLRGVVPNEMPIKFGLEALKAQAVAARNYVLMPRTKAYKEFDVDDSVASQVYFGAATETPLSNKAIDETEGLVALYNWDLILAQYSSTAGGYTESYENVFSDAKIFPSKPKPHLTGKPDILTVTPLNKEEDAKAFYMSTPDSYDMKSPYYRWKREWSADEVTEVLKKTLVSQSKTGFIKPEFTETSTFKDLKELKVIKRGVSGKIIELEIITDKGNYKIVKELVIRRVLQNKGTSLPSANVVFENIYDEKGKLIKIIAYGGGYGHGVGMSQYGAGFMSTSLHKPFDKILKRYYSGITISTSPIILSSNALQSAITQSFYAPYKKAVLIIDNKYNIKKFNAIINGETVELEMSNSTIPVNRFTKIDISEYIKRGKNAITFYYPEHCEGKAIRLYIELVEKDECEYSF